MQPPYDWDDDDDEPAVYGERLVVRVLYRVWLVVRFVLVFALLVVAVAAAFLVLGATVIFVIRFLIQRGEA